jgi:hypothetical protein
VEVFDPASTLGKCARVQEPRDVTKNKIVSGISMQMFLHRYASNQLFYRESVSHYSPVIKSKERTTNKNCFEPKTGGSEGNFSETDTACDVFPRVCNLP